MAHNGNEHIRTRYPANFQLFYPLYLKNPLFNRDTEEKLQLVTQSSTAADKSANIYAMDTDITALPFIIIIFIIIIAIIVVIIIIIIIIIIVIIIIIIMVVSFKK